MKDAGLELRLKVLLLLVGMLLVLLGLSGQLTLGKRTQAMEAGLHTDLAELVVLTGGLVHEGQKERGLTSGYLSSGKKRFLTELETQRTHTDRAQGLWQAWFKKGNWKKFNAVLVKQVERAAAVGEQLKEIRQEVDEAAATAQEMVSRYTKQLGIMLELVAELPRHAGDVTLVAHTSAYAALVAGKELAGQERALMMAVFTADRFDPERLSRYALLVGGQKTYFQLLFDRVTPEQLSSLKQWQASPVEEEVARIRQLVFARAMTGGFGMDPAVWFQSASKRIDLLKDLEDQLANDLSALASGMKQQADRAFWGYLAITCVVVGGLLVMVGRGVRVVGERVQKILDGLSGLAQGNLRSRVELGQGRDELSTIAVGINRMAEALTIHLRTVGIEADAVAGVAGELVVLRQSLNQEADATHHLAKGVVEENVRLDSELQQLKQDVDAAAERVERVSQAAAASARDVRQSAAATDQASDNVSAMAAAAEEMTASLAGVNDHLGRVSVSVTRVVERVNALHGLSQDIRSQCSMAEDVSSQANQAAQSALATIETLLSSANEIGNVVKLINSIAGQTSMLAINASIEAARAGESGKGFAVVAAEVRELAKQTAEATRMISDRTREIHLKTQEVVAVTREMGGLIDQIGKGNSAIGLAVNDQYLAVEEIGQSMEHIATASQEVTRNASELGLASQEVAVRAQEAASSTGQIAHSASVIARHAGQVAEDSEVARGKVVSMRGAAQEIFSASALVQKMMLQTMDHIDSLNKTISSSSQLMDALHRSNQSLRQANEEWSA
ncbi:MAG: nitrate- and nitrite sensing domain-containing protein [Magnetococcus sp. YQC-3]